jgi:uncharacterized protein (TIGR02246 family)
MKLLTRISRIVAGMAIVAFVAFVVRRAVTLLRSESTADVQAAIDRANRAYLDALERGDSAAYSSLFTDDALSMPARGAAIRGRDAIEASVAGAFKHVAFRSGRIRTAETRVEGKTAYELGGYTFEITANGTDQKLAGRYLVVWEKVGSTWKIAVEASQPSVVRETSSKSNGIGHPVDSRQAPELLQANE